MFQRNKWILDMFFDMYHLHSRRAFPTFVFHIRLLHPKNIADQGKISGKFCFQTRHSNRVGQSCNHIVCRIGIRGNFSYKRHRSSSFSSFPIPHSPHSAHKVCRDKRARIVHYSRTSADRSVCDTFDMTVDTCYNCNQDKNLFGIPYCNILTTCPYSSGLIGKDVLEGCKVVAKKGYLCPWGVLFQD